MRYDRARSSLDRHATYIVAAYVAGADRILVSDASRSLAKREPIWRDDGTSVVVGRAAQIRSYGPLPFGLLRAAARRLRLVA
jgi:hypothetical protein